MRRKVPGAIAVVVVLTVSAVGIQTANSTMGNLPIRAHLPLVASDSTTGGARTAPGPSVANSGPCGPGETGASTSPNAGPITGLTPEGQGTIVYDANQGVCWLADANLAGDSNLRADLGVAGINPNGTMDYSTAQKWVAALNRYDNGAGYLGHTNWQLPVAPLKDGTCTDTGTGGGSFGLLCTGNALGNLYSVGLKLAFPQSVAQQFAAVVPPMQGLKLSDYWALQNNGGTGSGAGGGGQEVFSFANGMQGGITTRANYHYVLPMVPGPIGDKPSCPPDSSRVVRYSSGPAGQNAVYDCNTGYTWTMDANLAATNAFGLTGDSTIEFHSRTVTAPSVIGGAMLFETARQLVGAMQASHYLGSSAWQLPTQSKDLETLFADLGLTAGDVRLMSKESSGPFENLQPFSYWECGRDQTGSSRSPCTGYAPADGQQQMQWSFNFDYGFQATSSVTQRYFVMVYYPAHN